MLYVLYLNKSTAALVNVDLVNILYFKMDEVLTNYCKVSSKEQDTYCQVVPHIFVSFSSNNPGKSW